MVDDLDYVVNEAGMGRRAFLRRMLVGSAFATPVVASFAMTGVAAASPGRHGPQQPYVPIGNANSTVIANQNSNCGGSGQPVISNHNQTGGEQDPFCNDFLAFERSICGDGGED
jgi:hypothetical protein